MRIRCDYRASASRRSRGSRELPDALGSVLWHWQPWQDPPRRRCSRDHRDSPPSLGCACLADRHTPILVSRELVDTPCFLRTSPHGARSSLRSSSPGRSPHGLCTTQRSYGLGNLTARCGGGRGRGWPCRVAPLSAASRDSAPVLSMVVAARRALDGRPDTRRSIATPPRAPIGSRAARVRSAGSDTGVIRSDERAPVAQSVVGASNCSTAQRRRSLGRSGQGPNPH